eukprot:9388944-Pyramimonas_sp.AAC.2
MVSPCSMPDSTASRVHAYGSVWCFFALLARRCGVMSSALPANLLPCAAGVAVSGDTCHHWDAGLHSRGAAGVAVGGDTCHHWDAGLHSRGVRRGIVAAPPLPGVAGLS